MVEWTGRQGGWVGLGVWAGGRVGGWVGEQPSSSKTTARLNRKGSWSSTRSTNSQCGVQVLLELIATEPCWTGWGQRRQRWTIARGSGFAAKSSPQERHHSHSLKTCLRKHIIGALLPSMGEDWVPRDLAIPAASGGMPYQEDNEWTYWH